MLKFNRYSEKETQRMLDTMQALCQALIAAGAGVSKLKLIDRATSETTWCRNFCSGLYVRPIWSNQPERTDGYYDIYVDGSSPWGAILDVINGLRDTI